MPERIRSRPGGALRRRIAAATLAVGLVLVPVATQPAAAAGTLHNPSVSPTVGTTATTFVASVEYSSDPPQSAREVTVRFVGPMTIELPMALDPSDELEAGTWTASTMLPEGTWTVSFTASPPGEDPTAVGPTVVVTPAATAPPSASPTTAPTAAPTTPPASPRPTARPTARPTPRPPGVTPAPTARPTPLPPGVTPGPTTAATAEPDGSGSPPAGPSGTGRPSGSPPPSGEPSGSAEGGPNPTPPASPTSANGPGSAVGIGRTGWVVLGGVTSLAGAFVLAQQWRARRARGG